MKESNARFNGWLAFIIGALGTGIAHAIYGEVTGNFIGPFWFQLLTGTITVGWVTGGIAGLITYQITLKREATQQGWLKLERRLDRLEEKSVDLRIAFDELSDELSDD